MWVNVFFESHCKYLSDEQLLLYIHEYVRSESLAMTATPDPLEDYTDSCLSINVDTRDTQWSNSVNIDGMVFERVQQWIRDFPMNGLPFDRGKIFTKRTTGGNHGYRAMAYVVPLMILLFVDIWFRIFPCD
ncbi:hypothetical protein N7468_004465 [Penicillium chermesinum]|uniref:Uncharacterized protein n=1 Tax=Penicillium chermesinum TaxID=63820 RepID=A0A9W9P983_9EURO|nr:uncharacterized protein N7468_004465 [Penicillium chermesinum]KAJ5239846.1 hypothetical protein N7468_004465 [Penicillium chermesinum]